MNILNELHQERGLNLTRRHFFKKGSNALGWAALSGLMAEGAKRPAQVTIAPG